MTSRLSPTTLDKTAWEKMLSITLDDLSKQIAPEIMIICEGSSSGTRRKNFDAEIYNKILGAHMPNVVFISGGSAYQVEQNGNMLREILGSILPQTKIISLIDRDDMTNEKVQKIESKCNTIVLQKRNLESYLFSDDVLEAFVKKEGKPDRYEQVLQLRSDELSASSERGNQSDDLKSAAGSIYIKLKKSMDLNQQGNNADEFMMYTLAPLIKPGMGTYENLKSAIWIELYVNDPYGIIVPKAVRLYRSVVCAGLPEQPAGPEPRPEKRQKANPGSFREPPEILWWLCGYEKRKNVKLGR